MKRVIVFIAILFVLVSGSAPSVPVQEGNQRIRSFSRAKTLLHKVVYSDDADRFTFYCGCKYNEKKEIDWESCGYTPGNQRKRAKRVEWEHIVPVHAFGKDLVEWKTGHPECVDSKGKSFKGRNCASKMNELFQFMAADMYNLVPSVGEINAVRSNYPFKDKTTDEQPYGKCDFRVIKKKAMPADNTKGKIARVYLYMESAYPGFNIVHHKNRKMFKEWDSSNPVTIDECLKNEKIEKLQGNRNHIVYSRCRNIKKQSNLLKIN